MKSPKVDLIVCGRFHYHKYLRFLFDKGGLNKFIYSYKLNYNFNIPPSYLKNYFLKEYLMYFGAKFLKGKRFFHYLTLLHKIWQLQVRSANSTPDLVHFLVHGNCDRIIENYKRKNIKIIGEVVNAHPVVQEQILMTEYNCHNVAYEPGEKIFKDKILMEYALCDYLLAPSSFIKRSLIQGGIDAEKIRVLPYGTEANIYKKENTKIGTEEKIKILCVSQLTFRKGTIYLLKALSGLIDKGYLCELTLIGKLDPLYAQVIDPYLSKPFVNHIHHISNDLMYKTMLEHDLLVMPSLEDGFGIVVSEAISVHLPVVVTENCGAAEVIKDGVNGWIVEPFSEEALSEGIVKSIDYDFDFSEKIPDWVNYTNGLIDIYTEIVNKN